MAIIKLCSGDGEIIETSKKTIKCSATLREALKCGDGNDVCIPLPCIDSKTLRKVLRWAEYHKYDEDEPCMRYDKRNMVNYIEICDWDARYFKVPITEMHYIIKAADFLQIKALVDLACQNVANRLAHCTAQEMQEILLINTDIFDAEHEHHHQSHQVNHLEMNLPAELGHIDEEVYSNDGNEDEEEEEDDDEDEDENNDTGTDADADNETDESDANEQDENNNTTHYIDNNNIMINGNDDATHDAYTDIDTDTDTDTDTYDYDDEQSALSARSSPTSTTSTDTSDSIGPHLYRWPRFILSESESSEIDFNI